MGVPAMLKKGVFWPLHTRRLQNGTAPPGEMAAIESPKQAKLIH